MAKKPERKGLGRGLSALMADIDVPTAETEPEARSASGVVMVPVEKVHPNPDQPRQDFDKDDLNDLSSSIAEKGIIQPLLVVNSADKTDTYQIVAGERRWRAAQLAKLHEVPIIVKDFSEQEILEVAIIENIQRADLNPVEEALGYRQLMDRFGHTQEQVSDSLGKSRSHIANLLRLLKLPEGVLAMVREGALSMGHARALVTADHPMDLAKAVVAGALSVRDTEKLAKSGLDPAKAAKPAKPQKDSDTRALEGDLTANLKMKVAIDHAAKGEAGVVKISYKNLDDLDRLCQLLSQG